MGELRFEVSPPELKDLEYSRITFVLLSALFPIIGGVCLAIAIKKLRSFSLLWKTKKEQKKLRRKLYKTQKELSQFEQDSENCKTYINWTTTDEFIKELANFLFACYIHGYEYAYRKHNAGLDIMEKAEEIRRLFSGDSAQLNSDYPF